MRTPIVFTLISLLISVSPQYIPVSYQSNGIVFAGCDLPICWSGTLRGFKCRSGTCKIICTEVGCFENELSIPSPPSLSPSQSPPRSHKKISENMIDVRVGQGKKATSQRYWKTFDVKNPLQLYSKFENCTSKFCLQGDYSGFECGSGFCSTVCKRENCYHFVVST